MNKNICHPRVRGGPATSFWIPAFAGMTLLFLFFSPASHAKEWVITKGTHFDVLLETEDPATANHVLEKAEAILARITKELGEDALMRKWEAKDRVTIKIYETQSELNKAEKAPEWASGHAHFDTRTIASSKEANGFLVSTLPHEIAHFILYDLTGSYLNVPMWLHEGFALAQEDEIRPDLKWALKDAASKGYLVSLKLLTIVNPTHQKQDGAFTYYAESQAFVRFIIDRHGANRFKQFILSLSKGTDFNTAIEKTYKGIYKDLDDLEAKFFESIKS